ELMPRQALHASSITFKHPMAEGKDGISVKNEKIAVMPPKDVIIPFGKNTMPSPDDPNTLIAATDGLAKLKDKKIIEVDPVYEIKGHVDFSTGNVKFIGSVKIKGDVKSGFKVEADGPVEVDGVVEDATIISGGNVIVKLGFIGRGNGKIVSKGSVYLKYCDNQKIYAEKDVIVSEHIINGYIRAGEKVIVAGKSGVITGGEIIALHGIEVKNLGSKQHIKTLIYLGITEEFKDKYNETLKEIIKGKENLTHIEEGINIIIKIKLLKKGLSKEKEELLEKLTNAKELILTQQKNLLSKRKKLLDDMKSYKHAYLKVFHIVFPNVRIYIFNRKYINQYEISKVMFQYSDKEVVYKPLEEKPAK
ncbi:DUF342 domain-containing protein, partial [candidate division KSB1 bacterium]